MILLFFWDIEVHIIDDALDIPHENEGLKVINTWLYYCINT